MQTWEVVSRFNEEPLPGLVIAASADLAVALKLSADVYRWIDPRKVMARPVTQGAA